MGNLRADDAPGMSRNFPGLRRFCHPISGILDYFPRHDVQAMLKDGLS